MKKKNETQFSPPMAHQPLAGQGLLIIEASRSHSDTPHSVGLLWTSDQHDAHVYLTTHNTNNRIAHAPGWIRTHNSSKRAASDQRLRPRANWDRM